METKVKKKKEEKKAVCWYWYSRMQQPPSFNLKYKYQFTEDCSSSNVTLKLGHSQQNCDGIVKINGDDHCIKF